MSVSLIFPTVLSDIIVAKQIGNREPKWSFALTNDKLEINLTWENVSNEKLVLSPPPLAPTKQTPATTYAKSHYRSYRNELPPRFQNKYVNDKWEKINHHSNTVYPSSLTSSAQSNGKYEHPYVKSTNEVYSNSLCTSTALPVDNTSISNTNSVHSEHSPFNSHDSDILVTPTCSNSCTKIKDTHREFDNTETKSFHRVSNPSLTVAVEALDVEDHGLCIANDILSDAGSKSDVPNHASDISPIVTPGLPISPVVQIGFESLKVKDHDICDDSSVNNRNDLSLGSIDPASPGIYVTHGNDVSLMSIDPSSAGSSGDVGHRYEVYNTTGVDSNPNISDSSVNNRNDLSLESIDPSSPSIAVTNKNDLSIESIDPSSPGISVTHGNDVSLKSIDPSSAGTSGDVGHRNEVYNTTGADSNPNINDTCKPALFTSDSVDYRNSNQDIPISGNEFKNELTEPPCISGKNVSRENIMEWIDNFVMYLKSQERFLSLIDASWSKSPKVEFRGLMDDPVTGHSAEYRSKQLKHLFYVLSKSCPLAKSYMSLHSTSLDRVWTLVYHHFGYYD